MKLITKIFAQIIESRFNSISFVFLIALIVRVFLVFTNDLNRITPDAISYYESAVNIEKGNGYSISKIEPFAPYYFREPAYPHFLAIGLWIFDKAGGEVNYLDRNSMERSDLGIILSPTPFSIIYLKLWQAFWDSIGVALFLYTILMLLKRQYAFWISLALCFYLPIAAFPTYIGRESFEIILFILIVAMQVKYFLNNKSSYLFLFSFFFAVAILTLQVYALIPVIFFLFLLLIKQNFKYAFFQSILSGLVTTFFLLPWIIHVYQYYPDIKVVKSFGSGFTHEMRQLNNAQFKALRLGLIEREDFDAQWGMPTKLQFDLSFNGQYLKQADSINVLINSKVEKRMQYMDASKFYLHNLYNTIFFPKQFPLNIITFFIGLLGVAGIYIFRKYIWYFTFPVLYHFSLFFIIGDEGRRAAPAQPFLLLSALLLLFCIYSAILKKKSFSETFSDIFLKN